MAACTTTIHGKVCDAGGKPVAGAAVIAAEGGLDVRTVTDDAGAFTLSRLPEGELHLVAATATGGGVAICTEHTQDVRITWTPNTVIKPIDIPLAVRLLDDDLKLPKGQRRFNRAEFIHALADVDLDTALRLAQAGDAPLPKAYALICWASKRKGIRRRSATSWCN